MEIPVLNVGAIAHMAPFVSALKKVCTTPMSTIICLNCKKEFSVYKVREKTAKYCSRGCQNIHWKGFKRSDEFKEKVRRGMIGVNTWTKGKPRPDRQGANCHFGKGGVSKQNRTERQNFTRNIEYINFRRNVLKRDNYTCQVCNERTRKGKRVILQVDHIKPFLLFPELRLDMNNARTLCRQCHYKTDTYGAKIHKMK